MENIIYKYNNVINGTIISRPSKLIKSPYVADVQLENGEIILAHCPALGCCGYCNKESKVSLIPLENPKKCSHRIIFSKLIEEKNINNIKKLHKVIIGTEPKLCERIVHNILIKNIMKQNLDIKAFKPEQTIENSRFDFVGTTKNDEKLILEVKSVPIAHYENITIKERKGRDYLTIPFNNKIAYFPDGYRKKKSDPISPRALKHIQELMKIKQENPNYRTIICFVITRNDINSFQPSVLDPIYKEALIEALNNGVELLTIKLKNKEDGSVYLLEYKFTNLD